MIEVNIERKVFGATEILQNICFSIPRGNRLALLGPSGIGKSTLLRIVAGLDRNFVGSVAAPPKVGIVFQEPTLLPWRRVRDNLAVIHRGLKVCALDQMLDKVGLADKRHFWPSELSLGQQRRLSLARAFLGTPDFLILDEPYASLDRELHSEMIAVTKQLIGEYAPSILLVTHDCHEARDLAHQVLMLQGSPATLGDHIK